MLTQHGVQIAPSTYYDARGRGQSPRAVSDERWKPIILATWQEQRKVLGARKLWLRLRRNGHDIARCTVERLMRELGIAGVVRGKRKRPVDTEPRQTRPADLVDRHFARLRTNQLWVADFTYVWTWSGWVYVAFVFDAHSRRILGWRAATSMTTPLVLDCLDMALWARRCEGVTAFTGLTHHTDAGSVYTSIAFTDRLIDEGIDPSVGSVGDAYDNSLAESQIGLYKSELIHHEGPWRDVDQSRGRHCLLGAVVQHRTHPRLHRRPHAPRGRTTRLRSQRTGRTSRLTPAKHSPDTPGRVSLQSVRRDFSYRHNGDLSLRHLTNELVQRNVRLRKSGVLQALAKSTTSQSAPSEVAASSASFRSRTISNGSCQARSSSTSSNPIKIA